MFGENGHINCLNTYVKKALGCLQGNGITSLSYVICFYIKRINVFG